MENPLQQIQLIIDAYGIYAVFGLCMVEGDVTLLLAGAMANSGFFGQFSFFRVLLAGILGGVIGDTIGYLIGRVFAKTIKGFKWYQRSQPRIERLVENFGGYALVISKYIYGIRAAMCTDETLARYSREHNAANVLTLGATLVDVDAAKAIVLRFLESSMREPRYAARIDKITRLERR